MSIRYKGTLIIVIVAAIVVLSIVYTLKRYLSSSNDKKNEVYTPFLAKKVDMAIDGTVFWDKMASYHGMEPQILPTYSYPQKEARGDSALKDSKSYTSICRNFFAVWPGDCLAKQDELHDRLQVFSSQMIAMNATFTLYVSDSNGCNVFNYTNIFVEIFDKIELLTAYGFSSAFPIMDKWVKTRYTRISDILRLALAHRFQKSYVDTDVHFLMLRRNLYEVAYVGVGMYGDSRNAIEITNAAFCLPRVVLLDMLAYQKNRILKGSDHYFYTELGPSLFHKVVSILIALNNSI